MKFPNAFSGSKKLFVAEILTLITAVLTIIGALVAFGSVKSGSLDGAFGGGALIIIAGIVAIIAIVFQFIGVTECSRDEPKFKTALAALIVNLVASVISSFTKGTLSSVFSGISTLASICAIYFIITGFISLADKLGNGEVSSFGKTVLIISVGVLVVSAVLSIITGIITPSEITLDSLSSYKTTRILTLIASVLSLVQTVVYLLFLNKSKEMLAE